MGTHKTEINNKYNSETYDRVSVCLRKEQARQYKARCAELGISMAEPLRRAVERFLTDGKY